jgi:hypothetical protein
VENSSSFHYCVVLAMACREVLLIVVNSSRDALFCLVGLTRVLLKRPDFHQVVSSFMHHYNRFLQ